MSKWVPFGCFVVLSSLLLLSGHQNSVLRKKVGELELAKTQAESGAVSGVLHVERVEEKSASQVQAEEYGNAFQKAFWEELHKNKQVIPTQAEWDALKGAVIDTVVRHDAIIKQNEELRKELDIVKANPRVIVVNGEDCKSGFSYLGIQICGIANVTPLGAGVRAK
jgi:hypothetical protein